ncbi:MAG: UxaA family hydrolase [Desulfovibrionaceae bacterium]|nr:UxaA family hydrolase [Desulfovibrionaceae bacterium]
MTGNDFLRMGGKKTAIVIHKDDNVAVTLADVQAGEECVIREENGGQYTLHARDAVAFGHKIALAGLKKDDPVFKYGEEIGKMKEPVAKGGWIHSHNISCERGM